MSTQQHTPGPWAVNTAGTGDGKGRFVIDEIYVYAPDSGANDVAVAADIADPLTGKPSEANARLIAAAPDHALILKAIATLGARWDSWNELGGEFCIGGFKYATGLDEFGCPVVNGAIRAAIARTGGAA